MIGDSTARTRLCPHCANSIAEDAADCRYCKADFSSQFAPKWLKRGEASPESPISSDNHKRFSIPANAIWMGAMLVVALIAFFAGGYIQRSELMLSSPANLKQLQAKDQMIQSQETQLAQTRQELDDTSKQLAEMKTKLEVSQKELSLAQQRLSTAARQADRQNASRSPAARRTASRAPDTSASLPQPRVASRTAAAGVYETTRATSVYENPSSASRVLSQISKGTRITVVRSAGDWLEVRSKHGNPPGYVRTDDARVIGGAK
ncbi:MAG: SH3 domain-containing protein [Candidatus Binatia bacterium]